MKHSIVRWFISNIYSYIIRRASKIRLPSQPTWGVMLSSTFSKSRGSIRSREALGGATRTRFILKWTPSLESHDIPRLLLSQLHSPLLRARTRRRYSQQAGRGNIRERSSLASLGKRARRISFYVNAFTARDGAYNRAQPRKRVNSATDSAGKRRTTGGSVRLRKSVSEDRERRRMSGEPRVLLTIRLLSRHPRPLPAEKY